MKKPAKKTEIKMREPSKFETLMRWRGRQLLKAKTSKARHRVFVQFVAECAMHMVNKTPPPRKDNKPSILEHLRTFMGDKLSNEIVARLRSRKIEHWMALCVPTAEGFPMESIWDQYEPMLKKLLSTPEGQDDPWLQDPPSRR